MFLNRFANSAAKTRIIFTESKSGLLTPFLYLSFIVCYVSANRRNLSNVRSRPSSL